MTEVVVFHHAQGSTEGLHRFAEQLRGQGHHVSLPDLYEGRTFADLESGIAYAAEFGGSWPFGVPVQVHAMEADPLFTDEGDLEAARELVARSDEAELFLYPG